MRTDPVEFGCRKGDRETRESHFTHTLANSFRQGGNAPAIYARSEGRDTVLIGRYAYLILDKSGTIDPNAVVAAAYR